MMQGPEASPLHTVFLQFWSRGSCETWDVVFFLVDSFRSIRENIAKGEDPPDGLNRMKIEKKRVRDGKRTGLVDIEVNVPVACPDTRSSPHFTG